MADGSLDRYEGLALQDQVIIDRLCSSYEAALRAGEDPSPEEYLHKAGLSDPACLLTELVAIDRAYRRGQGFSREDYVARFPDFAAAVDDAFRSDAVTRLGPPPRPAAPPPPAIDGYEVLGELGQGGMGVVYKARDLRLKRLVALKVILQGDFASEQHRARFLVESEMLARLRHPNVVQVFEAGQQGGRPFLALEYVEGGTLAQRIAAEGPIAPREAAALVCQLARAVHHAHLQGVIHRDLKPANVLLSPSPSGPMPKITDFGLACQPGGGELSQTGQVMGTPSYMPPEQARGERRSLGPAADVYSLGVVLYEALTGQPPFRAATPLETVHQVLNDEPAPPSRLRPGLDADLATICLKCLSKEPEKRYPSAAELADDLVRYQEGKPILARAVGRLERAVKWVRRNPVVAGAAAAVLLVTALGVGGVVWKYLDAEQQRRIALHEADKATKAREFLVSIFQKAEADEKGGNVTVRQLLDEAETRIPAEFADQAELRQDMVKVIGKAKRGIARRVPRAMILEVRGTVQLQSAAGMKKAAVPQALVYLDDRLNLGTDADVQLVFLSDLHKERLKAGRKVTVDAKGCEPAGAVLERDDSALMTFVRLPKGTFYMGWGGVQPREGDILESSASVVLQGRPFTAAALLAYHRTAPGRGWKAQIKEDFEIAVHAVTQGQWEAVMGSNPSLFSRKGPSQASVLNISDEELKLFPVEMVSWDDAQEFLKKLNEKERGRGYLYRLPSEAEWEYACRGGATSLAECSYHFYFDKPTNDLSSQQANFNGNYPFGNANKGPYLLRPTRVGAYPPNKLGLCDMHGNVRQWTSSRAGSVRLYRGGDWFRGGSNCRAALRVGDDPTVRYSHIGLRLARVPVR